MDNIYIREMAEALLDQLGIPLEDAMTILSGYWKDKIADVWTLDEFIDVAIDNGHPITREMALRVAKYVQNHINPEVGISWIGLQVAIEDYSKLALIDIPPEQRALVYEVFAVWRAKDEHGYLFGDFETPMQLGNLTKAMEQADALAMQQSGEPVFVACIGKGTPTNVAPVTLNILPALAAYKDPEKGRVIVEDGRFFTGRESMQKVY